MDRAERTTTPFLEPRRSRPTQRETPPTPPSPQQNQRPGGEAPTPPRWTGWLPIILLLGGIWVWQLVGTHESKEPFISYTAFYDEAQAGKIDTLTITGRHVTGHFKDKETVDGRQLQTFTTNLPDVDDKDLLPMLRDKKVDVRIKSEEQSFFTQLLVGMLPWVFLIGAWVWISKRMAKAMPGGPGGPLAGIIKGRTKRFEVKNETRVRFDDVAGLRSAKQDLQEIVEFLKHPERFRRLGGKVPRGVLLVGPPGTGKTLVARAVAGEAGVPFFSINGSEFIELFVGVGAARVRELFDEAKKAAPSIVFIDEIDAVGRVRGTGLGGGNDEREQTLNQLLSEMDGFARTDQVVVIAATNRPDVLDPALLRPGRFDRRIVVDRPESEARYAILLVHTKDKPIASDVNLRDIAANTPGFSGADLANLVNEAALNATRRGADQIEGKDFSAAYDKVLLGDPREARLLPEEKSRVAVHESGHAIVAHFTPFAEPLHRVTILPRGMALGVTQQTPGDDRHIATQPELEAKLRVLMGGYAAESEILGNVSSGSENDLQKATEIAYRMVAHFGMSQTIGPVYHEHHTEHPFLGQRLATEGGVSDETVHTIEQEARQLLTKALADARQCVRDHRPSFEKLVDALLEKETIEKSQLVDMLGAPPLPRPPTSGGELVPPGT